MALSHDVWVDIVHGTFISCCGSIICNCNHHKMWILLKQRYVRPSLDCSLMPSAWALKVGDAPDLWPALFHNPSISSIAYSFHHSGQKLYSSTHEGDIFAMLEITVGSVRSEILFNWLYYTRISTDAQPVQSQRNKTSHLLLQTTSAVIVSLHWLVAYN